MAAGADRQRLTSFKERRGALLADASLKGRDFARAYAALADEWLRALLGDTEGVTLVALGGYGRSELCPHSDLDVLLLHDGRRDVDELARRIWYPIWDSGVRLDHSARTARDTLRLARAELKVALGLLDARPVAGAAAPAKKLRAEATTQWQEHGRRRLGELRDSTAKRHESYGDVAFLLEPDLKEAKGGLRDVTTLRAVAVAAPFTVRSNVGAEGAAEVLFSARVELHRESARPNDRLLLQAQDDVAAALDYADADALMAAIADAGRRLAWVSDDAWRRVEGWLEGPAGHRAGRDRAVGPGLVLRSDEIWLVQPVAEDADDSLTLRAVAEAARHGACISHEAMAVLGGLRSLPEPWPAQARQDFLELLGSQTSLVEMFETLDHYGVWTRLIPEWEPVRSRPQRNAYHRFTVDRHLVEATRNAAGITEDVDRPDLLLMGALLHDIGKGYPGDHSQVGATLATTIGTRVGFGPDDVAVLGRLVRLHLLLADVASRRDLDDPGTIDSVATQVGDVSTLE
ncbi:MAG: HD domain-containing protein, partial [Acidimicrobiales bacterium]